MEDVLYFPIPQSGLNGVIAKTNPSSGRASDWLRVNGTERGCS